MTAGRNEPGSPALVHIVLPTDDVGGAEKRFAGLFLHLRKTNRIDARLVASTALVDRLADLPELAALASHRTAMTLFSPGRPREVLPRLLRGLYHEAPRSVFHYVMISPLLVQRFFSPRTLFTIPNATLDFLNVKGKADILGGVLRASRTDVLDPLLYRRLARAFPFKTGALSVTPNSFVDLDHYTPAPVSERESLLVFTGLFSDEKQAFRLANAIPEVLETLASRGIPPPSVRFLGRETRSPGIADACAAMAKRWDVSAGFERDPVRVLRRAKVFFSLQRASNYPSKALLEALACGVLPVVTDTGTTRRIARNDFAEFVPRDFSAADIANACARILSLSDKQYAARADVARRFVEERFSIDSMASYYALLYEQLAEL